MHCRDCDVVTRRDDSVGSLHFYCPYTGAEISDPRVTTEVAGAVAALMYGDDRELACPRNLVREDLFRTVKGRQQVASVLSLAQRKGKLDSLLATYLPDARELLCDLARKFLLKEHQRERLARLVRVAR